jgi:hypothetical protein
MTAPALRELEWHVYSTELSFHKKEFVVESFVLTHEMHLPLKRNSYPSMMQEWM